MSKFFSRFHHTVNSLRNSEDPFLSSILLIGLNFIPASVRIFLVPLYLNKLSPEEYGILNLVNTTANFIQIFAALGIANAVVSFYFVYNDDRAALKNYVGNIMAFSVLAVILFSLVSALAGPWIYSLLFQSSDVLFFPYGALAIGGTLCALVSSVYYSFLKNDKNLFEYGLFAIASVFLNLAFQAYFIMVNDMGVMGALWGSFISQALILIFVFISTREIFTFKFKREYLSKSLRYTIPLIPFHLIIWVTLRIDRFFIERILGIEKVGQYAALMGIAGIIYLVTTGINTGIRPFLFGYYKEGADINQNKIKDLVRLYIAFGLLAASGIILLGNNIDLVTQNPKYLEIIPIISFATLVTFIRCYWMLFNQTLIFVQKSVTISKLIFASMCILLILFVLLIPSYGIIGVLLASFITDLITSIFFYYAAEKQMHVAYNFKVILLIPFFFFSVIMTLQVLNNYGYLGTQQFSLIQFFFALVFLFFLLKKDIQARLNKA